MENSPLNPQPPQSPGFFPNMVSVVIFAVIMMGMFFGATRFYPELAQRYFLEKNGQNGQQTVEKKAESIAPFVRGTMVGIKTAQLSSVRSTEPININQIEGYQKGIKTAVLTSKNWYNLDRQLFRVQGMPLGVNLALATSKTTQARSTLEYQIKLTQQLQAALSTDLDDLLSANADSRQKTLDNYLNGLKKMASEAEVEVNNMERILTEAQAAIKANEDIASQYSESFNVSTEFDVGSVDRNMGAYLEARKKIEESKVRGKTINDVYKQLKPLSERSKTVISAIQNNYEALATGIKVSPTQGVNLPIIKE